MTSPLPRATPESHGLASGDVEAFLDAVDSDDRIELHSLMILRHGHVLAEGWWHPYKSDEIHLLYSLSKSFTSVAFGLAVAEGMLAMDDRVIDVFAEHRDAAADDRVRSLTFRHLLRMATGHRDDALGPDYEADPDDLVRGFLTVPPDQDPGTVFAYNNAATYTVAAAVQKVTGQRLVDYLRPRLFDKLGIDQTFWQQHPAGRDIGFSGLHLTTESVARFGQLLLQGGHWDGQQLLDPRWLAEATSVQTTTAQRDEPDGQRGYGYQFWMSRHGYRADGAYGQLCLVLPEQDAVIVMTSAAVDSHAPLDAVWRHLLPGFSDQPGHANGALRGLPERLAELALRPNRSPAPAEPGPVRVASVESVADGAHQLSIEHDGPPAPGIDDVRLSFTCGDNRWTSGVITHDQWRLPYAGTGSWTDDGVYDAEVAFTQTPHKLRLRFRADGSLSESTWHTPPLGPSFPAWLATTP